MRFPSLKNRKKGEWEQKANKMNILKYYVYTNQGYKKDINII